MTTQYYSNSSKINFHRFIQSHDCSIVIMYFYFAVHAGNSRYNGDYNSLIVCNI